MQGEQKIRILPQAGRPYQLVTLYVLTNAPQAVTAPSGGTCSRSLALSALLEVLVHSGWEELKRLFPRALTCKTGHIRTPGGFFGVCVRRGLALRNSQCGHSSSQFLPVIPDTHSIVTAIRRRLDNTLSPLPDKDWGWEWGVLGAGGQRGALRSRLFESRARVLYHRAAFMYVQQ